MGNSRLPAALVDADWLHQHLGDDDLLILDCSWHLPTSGRDAQQEFLESRIPGARFFDFDDRFSDPQSTLPHMLPDAALFTREAQKLGLRQDGSVVLYDVQGMYSSTRGWWMLRAMGFDNCALLDGGMPAWVEAGYPLESDAPAAESADGDFVARLNPDWVVDAQQVLAALADDEVAVVDARPAERFRGEAEEPRAGLRRGHMPGAVNLPFAELFRDGKLLPTRELEDRLAPLLEGRKRYYFSCGSGVTACILAFAAERAGYDGLAVYDGSWCEWGLPGELPVVTD